MLSELLVHNLLIVERATIAPGQGLTVISGETGAGKSLLLDALDLLLGGRGSPSLVGRWGDACTVAGVFALEPAQAREALADLGLPGDDGQIVLRRRLAAQGRSQAWVNEVPVTVQALRTIGSRLVDIRVQQEHLRLGDPERQMEILDRFGGNGELAEAYRQAHRQCSDLEQAIAALRDGEQASLREAEFLRFQLDEIERLDPREGEVEELEARQRLLAGAQEWLGLCAEAQEVLVDGEAAVVTALGRLAVRLSQAPDVDLGAAGEACRQAQDLVAGAGAAVARASGRIQADPAEQARIEERLSEHYRLQRKHGGTAAALLSTRRNLSARLESLDGLGARVDGLQQELAAAGARRLRLGEDLALKRRRAFATLAKRVRGELADLGMPRASLTLVEGAPRPTPQGLVPMELHVATNPGLPAGPLRAVASGGESSRLTLALAVVLADHDETPVLVFDEVDSGVGGRLAAAIGRKLADLARSRTVIGITHSPQIAAAAHRHLVVRKQQGERETRAEVVEIDGTARVREIADMLGGGQAARSQAEALLATGRG